jgi:hypothetical protein
MRHAVLALFVWATVSQVGAAQDRLTILNVTMSAAGDQVTVTGTGFGKTPVVTIDGQPAVVIASTDTQVSVVTPAVLLTASGTYRLTVMDSVRQVGEAFVVTSRGDASGTAVSTTPITNAPGSSGNVSLPAVASPPSPNSVGTAAAATVNNVLVAGPCAACAEAGTGVPGGSSGQVQFNNAGTFGGFGSWNGETFGLGLPATSGTLMNFDTGASNLVGDFTFNLSNTANAGEPTRPNPVMQWGYNLNPGGGPVIPHETAFGLGLEGNYAPGGTTEYNEAHLYFVDKAGIQHRPWSWRINKDTDDWQNLIHATSVSFFEALTNNQWATINSGGLSLTPIKVSGINTDGLAIVADSSSGSVMQVVPVGSKPKALILGGWRGGYAIGSVGISNSGQITTPSQINGATLRAQTAGGAVDLRSDGAGAGYVEWWGGAGGSTRLGRLGNDAADVRLNLFGGADFVVMKNGAEMMRVRNTNGMVTFGGTLNTLAAIKPSGATLQTRLADDSGFAATQSLYDRFGAGSPEGVVMAPVGASYHRTDGGAGTSLYVKESGSGNTGWVAK